MNVLVVNYGQADNNSAYHILGHARGLAARGHDVCVSVAKSVPDGVFEKQGGYRIASHKTALREGPRFANGRKADVLHAWTPRETVRQFAEKFLSAWGARATLIHLEDNETSIFQRFTGHSVEEAALMEQEWPKGLIHPALHRKFLEIAQGVTMVHQCLDPLVPDALPRFELVPGMDFEFFSNGDCASGLRAQFGIPATSSVIAFNGNDHAAAALDIRQLYEAAEILLKRGRDLWLVRTGHVLPGNYEGLDFRPGPRCLELGFIERNLVPEVMRMSDVTIQPGDEDAFNSHRLPAKVPEYLAVGRPLIMGTANIGRELASSHAACVLPRMSPEAMADAVEKLLDEPAAAREMGARGRAFAQRRFDRETVAAGLERFYSHCLNKV